VLLVLRSSNAPKDLPDDLRAPLYQTVTVRSLELPRLRDPRLLSAIFSINRILRDFSPQILHAQEQYPAHMGWVILSFRRHIPVVLTVHDHVPHSGAFSTDNWRWKVVQWFRWKADGVIVHGPRMQAELQELTGSVAGRIDVIPHRILGRAGIGDDISGWEAGTFLFFGRIQSYKGLRYLLDAGDVLRRRGRDFRLIVAGTGSDLEQHRKRIAASGWVELIDRFISPAEVPALFRRAMAVVMPYTDATQSGVPDVVVDGQTGLVVPPRDEMALAGAMERLLVDCRLRDSLARSAARTAKEKLSWPRIADVTCDTYRRALDSHRAKRSGNPSRPSGIAA
jgi:glycosyltransferase involved in cell wall biosynthesis